MIDSLFLLAFIVIAFTGRTGLLIGSVSVGNLLLFLSPVHSVPCNFTAAFTFSILVCLSNLNFKTNLLLIAAAGIQLAAGLDGILTLEETWYYNNYQWFVISVNILLLINCYKLRKIGNINFTNIRHFVFFKRSIQSKKAI